MQDFPFAVTLILTGGTFLPKASSPRCDGRFLHDSLITGRVFAGTFALRAPIKELIRNSRQYSARSSVHIANRYSEINKTSLGRTKFVQVNIDIVD